MYIRILYVGFFCLCLSNTSIISHAQLAENSPPSTLGDLNLQEESKDIIGNDEFVIIDGIQIPLEFLEGEIEELEPEAGIPTSAAIMSFSDPFRTGIPMEESEVGLLPAPPDRHPIRSSMSRIELCLTLNLENCPGVKDYK